MSEKKYGIHKYLLVADSTGSLAQFAAAPAGYTFDHTEWAVGNPNNNLVATLTNIDGAHKKISLINLNDDTVIDLAEGEELWHPNLWIKPKPIVISSSSSIIESNSSQLSSNSNTESSSSFDIEIKSSSSGEPEENGPFVLDPDSAGIYYNTSNAHSHAHQWRYKMEFLWQYKDSATIAILGSSRTYYGGVSKNFNEPFFAVNLAVATNTHGGTYYFFNNYVIPHMKKLRIIITSIDIDLWHSVNFGIFSSAYKSYPGYVYDLNHNFWKDNYPEGLFESTYNSPGTSAGTALRNTLGFANTQTHSWGNANVSQDSNWMDVKSEFYYKNFEMLKDMAKTCNEHNIILIGIITPQNPKYAQTGAYGLAGLRRSEAPTLIQEISDISKEFPNFILMDENKMGDHDYTDDMAYDTDHLSSLGAEQLTHRLDSLIQTLNIDLESEMPQQ